MLGLIRGMISNGRPVRILVLSNYGELFRTVGGRVIWPTLAENSAQGICSFGQSLVHYRQESFFTCGFPPHAFAGTGTLRE